MADPTPQPDRAPELEVDAPPGPPRWVKVAGIVAGVLILLLLVLQLTGIGGQHGPARHFSGDGPPAPSSQSVSSPAAGAAG